MFGKFKCETASKFWGEEKTANLSLWARLWTRASGSRCDIFPYLPCCTLQVNENDVEISSNNKYLSEAFSPHAEWMQRTILEWFREFGKEIRNFSIMQQGKKIYPLDVPD